MSTKSAPAPKGAPAPKAAAAPKPPGAAPLPDAALKKRQVLDEPEDGAETTPPPGGSPWLATRSAKIIAVVSAVLILAVATALGFVAGSKFGAPSVVATSDIISGPATVVDGATIIIGNRTLRLQGIDAPPARFICRDGSWQLACGLQARQALEQAIATHWVECRRVGADAGRLLVQCRADNGLDLAATQVENGWAVVDQRQPGHYQPEESLARYRSSGLWRYEFANSRFWRADSNAG